jgi:hypothetical protein
MAKALIARIAPLTDELGVFNRGHLEGHGGIAAARMLERVRALWPDVPEREITHDLDPEVDLEVLAARITIDVGEAAVRLLEHDPPEALGWARTNLILDLRRYLARAESRRQEPGPRRC